ncbi:RHS repeat-associated core domain-containing protein, partial [Bradyrhizobium sp. Arg816]|nr:RHS repeat-associated core domain-containing protein [Bradyrhizobium sp. Arg816]
ASLGYDGRGNLTSSGSSGYGYSVDNQLVSGPGVTMLYEPGGGQLLQTYNSSTGADTRFAWAGGQKIAEVNASGWTITKRNVTWPDVDETLVWYEGSGTSDRRWLAADERGSVVAVSDASGNVIGVNSYDEYGIPAAGNIGRFQYTG